MFEILEAINGIVWGAPALIMILGIGLLLTIKTRFLQIRLFPKAWKLFLQQFKFKIRNNNNGNTSPYRALCTALAATVGTGNLAGVAGAISLGGPGAIFWMWLSGIIGMITKFAEIVLSMRYRIKHKGEYIGGPMITITQGLNNNWHFLAYISAFFGIIASFGVGNATQVNTVISAVTDAACAFGFLLQNKERIILSVCLAGVILFVLLGGANKIGEAAERIVPFAAAGYITLGIIVLIVRYEQIPGAMETIFQGAFSPKAVTGGIVGSCLRTLRVGAARGVFTNEAGMGTASIAHACAEGERAVYQGFMGIIEVFLDTIVICTITALVILCSDVIIPYGTDTGITLTSQAFTSVYGKWVHIPLSIALGLFAFATILGWSLYGLRCAQFLFGNRAWNVFVILQAAVVLIGAVLQTQTVWLISEIVNGLMAIPNLIAILLLTPSFLNVLKEYENSGVHYEPRKLSIK